MTICDYSVLDHSFLQSTLEDLTRMEEQANKEAKDPLLKQRFLSLIGNARDKAEAFAKVTGTDTPWLKVDYSLLLELQMDIFDLAYWVGQSEKYQQQWFKSDHGPCDAKRDTDHTPPTSTHSMCHENSKCDVDIALEQCLNHLAEVRKNVMRITHPQLIIVCEHFEAKFAIFFGELQSVDTVYHVETKVHDVVFAATGAFQALKVATAEASGYLAEHSFARWYQDHAVSLDNQHTELVRALSRFTCLNDVASIFPEVHHAYRVAPSGRETERTGATPPAFNAAKIAGLAALCVACLSRVYQAENKFKFEVQTRALTKAYCWAARLAYIPRQSDVYGGSKKPFKRVIEYPCLKPPNPLAMLVPDAETRYTKPLSPYATAILDSRKYVIDTLKPRMEETEWNIQACRESWGLLSQCVKYHTEYAHIEHREIEKARWEEYFEGQRKRHKLPPETFTFAKVSTYLDCVKANFKLFEGAYLLPFILRLLTIWYDLERNETSGSQSLRVKVAEHIEYLARCLSFLLEMTCQLIDVRHIIMNELYHHLPPYPGFNPWTIVLDSVATTMDQLRTYQARFDDIDPQKYGSMEKGRAIWGNPRVDFQVNPSDNGYLV
ncbi:hypothetical protein NMY22_g5840 [Coprinellus aureogranulatus]|nr:hypothetical protein NMY22_g5840 [Coprinellus aureogranulatus]